MRARMGVITSVGLAAVLILGAPGLAWAFFPFGEFDPFQEVHYMTWSMATLDQDLDGDVSGPNDGVPIVIEGGSAGFTDAEIETVKEAFAVWQQVPTTYVAFRFTGVTQDPLPQTNDLVNTVSLVLPGEASPLQAGQAGVTVTTYAVTDTFVQSGNFGFWVTGGQIIESDMFVDGALVRTTTPGDAPEFDLKSIVVHEAGHFVGLGHTPLNNLQLIGDIGTPKTQVESLAVALRDPSGVLQLVGATPTMYPVYFLTDDGQGNLSGGSSDLAPDDIGGVSFLYPRGSQSQFFAISQEARTLTREGFPSIPLAGGHIVAWADTDDNPLTPRIPLFSTMSGLYEIDTLLGGLFNLQGMYKTLETFALESPFEVSYVLTNSPLNGLSLRRQAPPGTDPTTYASVVGSVSAFNTTFPSQVFHELGDIMDISNVEAGTPLKFDIARSAVVSADSTKTLPTMLPGSRPMFGDENQICPLNVAVSASLTNNFPTALRGLRDHVLLRSAAGTALVDAYYRMSPAMARLLLRHTSVLRASQAAERAVEWAFVNYIPILLGGMAMVLAGSFLQRKRRRATVTALVLFAALLSSLPVGASTRNLSEEDMVALATDIIVGNVASLNSHIGEAGRYKGVITDLAITVTSVLKGGLNTGSTAYMKVVGGRVGDLVTMSAELPTFKEGEEVFLYLKYNEDFGYTVVGGRRGKYQVATDAKTGEKSVQAPSIESQPGLTDAQKAIGQTQAKAGTKDTAKNNGIPLDKFKQYVRDIVKQQSKQ